MAHPLPSGTDQGLNEEQALFDQLNSHSPVGEVIFYLVLLFGFLSYALDIFTYISHGVQRGCQTFLLYRCLVDCH